LGISEIVSSTNMHLFDANMAMKRFATPEAILEHFFRHRLLAYHRRKVPRFPLFLSSSLFLCLFLFLFLCVFLYRSLSFVWSSSRAACVLSVSFSFLLCVNLSICLSIYANQSLVILSLFLSVLSVGRSVGWLRSVGSSKIYVSFAEYRLFYRALLQKRLIILRSLLIVNHPISLFLSIHLSVLPDVRSICPSVCLSMYLPVCDCLSICHCLSICPSM